MNSRRRFLRSSLRAVLGASTAAGSGSLWAAASRTGNRAFGTDVSGKLGPPDENGIRLPPGLRARVIARSGEIPVAGSRYRWHAAPDGGATFPHADGGWIYVSNSELANGQGGASALRFNPQGEPVDAYSILRGTNRNCAGGTTPWGSWLSCEEVDDGLVWECDPLGLQRAIARPALGRFAHEAVAIDTQRQHVYLTEDKADSLLYRYRPGRTTPPGRLDLSSGVLEAIVAVDRASHKVSWQSVPDPQAKMVATRKQFNVAFRFDGGEGIVFHRNRISFATKGDNKIWEYDTAGDTLRVRYSAATHSTPILKGVDNLAITPNGTLLVAEDGDDLQIVALKRDDTLFPLLQLVGHNNSEVTGPAFDPSGQRLYFSSQRGTRGMSKYGITYEISGPAKRWLP